MLPVDFYRETRGQVHLGRDGSVVEDRGRLRHAVPASNGDYLFSEAGAGVQALVLIGRWDDVLNWIAKRGAAAIDNRIATLPDVFMGITYYRPGKRFRGLFPVHDAVTQIISGLVDVFVPGNDASAIIGGIKSIRDAFKSFAEMGGRAEKRQTRGTLADTPVYVKFNYLHEDGAARIGRGRIRFDVIHPIVVRALSDMSPIPA